MRRRIFALLLGTGGISWGQTPASTPEVRRAIPVDRTTNGGGEINFENPAWMSRIPKAVPATLPAEPTPMPVATPLPLDAPEPGGAMNPPPPTTAPSPEPGFTPFRPPGRIVVSPTPAPAPVATPTAAPAPPASASQGVPPPDEDGVIRLSPTTGSGDAMARDLERANAVYGRKMYDYAVTEYEKFLIAHPTGPGRDGALFRLGESHRLLGNEASARDAYERLVREFREGEFAGAGAYRLGEYLMADRLWDAALTQFRLAATQSSSNEVRMSALYNEGRCLQQLKRRDEAIKVYEQVLAKEGENPYRSYARLQLAGLQAEAGRKKEAMELYGNLAGDTSLPGNVQVTAAVKAGALAAELGQTKEAAAFFEKALAHPDVGEWKSIAIMGALRAYYSQEDYVKVTALVDKVLSDLPTENQSEALLLSANAFRAQGNARAASAVYERLLIRFPGSNQAGEAQFQRLLSMYQANDPGLVAAVNEFLKTNPPAKQQAQANLLKAETLFKQEKFTEAGPVYAEVYASKDLDEDIKSKALMKLGWCQAKTNQADGAVQSFTTYLEKYPKGASVLAAQVQRGLALQELKKYPEAMKDYEAIIADHPGTPERELALQQKALILGQQQDYKGMTATFEQLLKDYPKSAGAAQAHFWIGWAAYENKDYPAAIASLQEARKLDPKQYGVRAGLRVILSYYYQQNRDEVKKSLAAFQDVEPPAEVLRWLGEQSFNDGNYAEAEKYLRGTVKNGTSPDPQVSIQLAEALIAQGKAKEAAPYAAAYVEASREPHTRARGLIAQGKVALAAGQYDEATKRAEEAMLLQPEGRFNAEGRLLLGSIAMARGQYDEAARTFLTIAVLNNDPDITPPALEKAAEAYRKAGNTFEADKALRELQQRFPDYKKSKSAQANS